MRRYYPVELNYSPRIEKEEGTLAYHSQSLAQLNLANMIIIILQIPVMDHR